MGILGIGLYPIPKIPTKNRFSGKMMRKCLLVSENNKALYRRWIAWLLLYNHIKYT